jgi:hypothetical protein
MTIIKTLMCCFASLCVVSLFGCQAHSKSFPNKSFISNKQFKKIGTGFDCKFWVLEDFVKATKTTRSDDASKDASGKTTDELIFPKSTPAILKIWSGELVPFGKKNRLPIIYDPSDLIAPSEGMSYSPNDGWPTKYLISSRRSDGLVRFIVNGENEIINEDRVYSAAINTKTATEKTDNDVIEYFKDSYLGKCLVETNISFGDFDREGNWK